MQIPRAALLAAILAVMLAEGVRAQPAAPLPARFRDVALPVDQRVSDLISQLTTEEKISQLMMGSAAIPRLGIPAYHWWNEGLHGVARNGTATVFPQAIGLSATFDTDLMHRVAEVISTEARAKHLATLARTKDGSSNIYQGLTIWSPNINIFRDPRWGRGQETYGEDPFLTGQMAVAFVTGLQGPDLEHLKTVATVKHFAVHSGPERTRHVFSANVSERDLRETYLPAFETAITQGHAMSLMSAYNAINGTPAPANALLLTTILRDEWHFPGAVVGDVDTVADLWQGHKFAPDAAHASALAIRAGNDLCSGGTYGALKEAIEKKLIAESELDAPLRRLITLRFKLGLFDPQPPARYAGITPADNDTPAHDAIALEAARKSIVLLKNDGTLPWKAGDIHRLAILGPTGGDPWPLTGNYAGFPARPVTLVAGLRAALEPKGVAVSYHPAVPIVSGVLSPGEPLPAGVLFTGAAKATDGLRREVFAGRQFDAPPDPAQPKATATDANINLYWSDANPIEGIPAENANIRWSGVLVPPAAGDYVLSLTHNGSAQLFLDDRLIAGDAGNVATGELRTKATKRTLEAGKSYRVRIEYHQRGGETVGRIAFGWQPPGGVPEALEAANGADHILLTLGLSPNVEGEEMSVDAEGFTGGDRTSIVLPKSQRELLEQVAALGKPFTVVLTSGSCLSFDTSKPNAILQAWYYGQRGGDALAQTLLGENNPSGRLPITFYKADADLPDFSDYAMKNRTYRYFAGTPLFPFGHGLSYSTFKYESLAATQDAAAVTLTNMGDREGEEVVQVYGAAKNPVAGSPLRQLIGFQRVSLKAHETKTVAVPIKPGALRRWDEGAHKYVAPSGEYTFAAGPSSGSLPLQATVTFP